MCNWAANAASAGCRLVELRLAPSPALRGETRLMGVRAGWDELMRSGPGDRRRPADAERQESERPGADLAPPFNPSGYRNAPWLSHKAVWPTPVRPCGSGHLQAAARRRRHPRPRRDGNGGHSPSSLTTDLTSSSGVYATATAGSESNGGCHRASAFTRKGQRSRIGPSLSPSMGSSGVWTVSARTAPTQRRRTGTPR